MRQAEELECPSPALLNRYAGCLAGRIPGKQRPHEGSFVAEHAAALVPDAVRFDEIWVGTEQGTVVLIGGKAGEVDQRLDGFQESLR